MREVQAPSFCMVCVIASVMIVRWSNLPASRQISVIGVIPLKKGTQKDHIVGCHCERSDNGAKQSFY